MTTPSNSLSRYESRPLIEDAAVVAHSTRDNESETSFYSVTPAYFSTTDLWAPPGRFTDDMRLIHDLNCAMAGHGETSLEVVTYEVQEAPASTEMIRISRETTFRLATGRECHSAAQYEMQTPVFDAIETHGQQWMLDLRDVVHGHSDRAVRHAALRPEMLDASDEVLPSTWKPARRMPYEDSARLRKCRCQAKPYQFRGPREYHNPDARACRQC